MAKINFGAVVNDARGKINGNVFSKNASGPYVKRKVTPVNPNTPAQAQARSNLAIYSQQWSGTLTSSQRAAWTGFATLYPRVNVFGLPLTLNGLNMLVSTNSALAQIGAAPLTDPPASPATTPIPIDTTSFTVAKTSFVYEFKQTAAVPTAGCVYYIYSTPGLAPGRAANKSLYRLISHHSGGTGTFPFTIDISASQGNVFGDLIVGLRYNILVSTIDPLVGIPTVGQPMTAICGP